MEIKIHNYETGKVIPYIPPKEIQALIGEHPWMTGLPLPIKLSLMNSFEWLGSHPGTHKIIGYLSHNTKIFNKKLKQRLVASGVNLRELFENHEFGSSHELFTFNQPRTHFASNEQTPVFPSDGFLSHESITNINGQITSHVGNVKIDIGRMLGAQELLHNDYLNLFTNGGLHDLAILKPEHKHICSVPLKSRVKAMYRVGMKGEIFPVDTPNFRIAEQPVYSTDPALSLQRPDIFDGNQRMVFVLTTKVYGKEMDYIMVAHAASLVSGIEPCVNIGDEIHPGKILFKFHQGSSLSTLWPKEFENFFTFIQPLLEKTTRNHLLKILEGQVGYIPKGQSKKIPVNKNTKATVDELFSSIILP